MIVITKNSYNTSNMKYKDLTIGETFVIRDNTDAVFIATNVKFNATCIYSEDSKYHRGELVELEEFTKVTPVTLKTELIKSLSKERCV